MLDISGFLTSPEFVSQIASLITVILSSFLGSFLTAFLGGTGGTGL